MPFESIQALDRFFTNEGPTYALSLHTSASPSPTNELTAVNAPGYTRQPCTLAGTDHAYPPELHNGDDVTFGPATSDWPMVHSIGLQGGPDPDVLLAHYTLTPPERPTVRATKTYTVPAGFMELELPPRSTGSIGWHGSWESFDDLIRDPSKPYFGAALDIGGGHETIPLTNTEEVAKIAGVWLQMSLYEANPIGLDHLTSQVFAQATSNDSIETLWYWSPNANALVNYGALQVENVRREGTARFWTLTRGAPAEDLSNLLFVETVEPALHITPDDVYHWAPRNVQAPLVHG